MPSGNKVGYSDDDIEKLLSDIHSGKVNPYNLPEDLYFATADYLKKGVYEGLGGTPKTFEFGTPDQVLATELRENIYIFSAAKTFNQVEQMGSLMVGKDGEIIPFAEFKELATPMFDEFNSSHLETEYNTAVAQAQSATKWNKIEEQKEVLPFLKYSAVMDANTSEICANLNGTTLPVDDAFWDTFTPPNHFNCRCLVEQLDKEDAREYKTSPEEADDTAAETSELMNDVFKMNPGKDKVVFDEDHPYFDVAARYRNLAEENFNLPVPSEEI